MDFHKELHRIEAKEGLRGRKLQKALESFAWNITVLKVRGAHCAPVPPTAPLLVCREEGPAQRGCSRRAGWLCSMMSLCPAHPCGCVAWPCTGGGTEGLSTRGHIP